LVWAVKKYPIFFIIFALIMITTTTTIQVKKLMRQSVFFLSLIIIVAFAFASKGGGDKDKKKNVSFKNDFVPLRATTFTLKNGFTYSGSHILGQQKEKTSFSLNTVVTYQKGGLLYILPYKYKVNTSSINPSLSKTNLQMLDLKISMHK
jgi:hypothetical protein